MKNNMNIGRFVKSLDVRLILIIVSLLAVAWLQAPRLFDEYRVDEDFRYFYWMYKFEDPELFTDDKFQSYYVMTHLPWGDVPVTYYNLGYGLLFYVASFITSPILFSKLLPFILMPITVWYAFQLGQAVRDTRTGVVLALGFLFVNLASSSAISITNGLQRSFATTFIIMLIYYLQQQSYSRAAIVLVLSALLYAPTLILGGATWGIFILLMGWRMWPRLSVWQGGVVHLAIAFVLSVVILWPVILPQNSDTVVQESETSQQPAQSDESYKYIWDDPVYQQGGGIPLFVIFPIVGRGGLVDLGEDLINLFIFILIGGMIHWVCGRRAWALPLPVWSLLWATLVMFVLAWLAAWFTNSFLLYWPSRYTRVGLYLFLLIFVLLNIVDFIKEAPLFIRQNPKRLIWLVVAIEAVIAGLILFYPSQKTMISGFNMKWLLGLAGLAFGVLGVAILYKPPGPAPGINRTGKSFAGQIAIGLAVFVFISGWAIYTPLLTEVSYLNPLPQERELLEFVETLPKDTLIAGSPCALDSIELLARRQVLFSCEYFEEGPLVYEALTTYYTDNPQIVVNFCQKYGIDYLVVDLNTYTPEFLARKEIFFEPYNQSLLPYVAAKNSFALNQIPDELKIFKLENYFVVPCNSLDS